VKRLPKNAYIVIGVVILLSPIFSALSGDSPGPTPSTTQAQTPQPSNNQAEYSEPTTTQSPAATEDVSPSTATEPIAQESQELENRFAALLSQLTLAPEITGGYDRSLFRHWIDSDGDGCNTSKEVLIAEAIERPQVTGNCSLIGGLWYSAYDAVTTTDLSEFDVDHLIPLKEAWDSGAYAWTASQRRAFANDLGNPEALIAVSASSNRSKSDKDPADWLPPNQSYHCTYIEHWMKVKIFWSLSVDEREFQAIRRVAAGC